MGGHGGGVQEAGVSLCCRERWCGGRQGARGVRSHLQSLFDKSLCPPTPVPFSRLPSA